MSDVLMEAHSIVRMAAEPWAVGDSVKVAVSRAAHSLGLSFRRTRSLWYCEETCSLRATEMDQLRLRHRALLQQQMRRLEVERELIAARLAALEGTHENLVARVAGKDVDGTGAISGQPGRSVPAPIGSSARRVNS